MNRIRIVNLLVTDYDAAIAFYTHKLGFVVIEDMPFGDSRWVTLALPDHRDVTLALELAQSADDRALVGRQGGSFPLLGLGTSDCFADYERMKTRGVKFHGEPESGPWGTGVKLEDLYGNTIFISQETGA
jgi:catechol 2,3-dioxygenase-like lactoylglutathione lyase family enzyme